MTTLSEFYASVRAALGRGDALDSVIEAKTRQAVRWVERNADPGYQYMKKFYEFTIDKDAEHPHVLSAINPRVKCILMFRLNIGGEYHRVKRVDPLDVTELDVGLPVGYWLDGDGRIFLDCIPEEDYSAEILVVEYSEWGVNDSFTHWLLDNAEDLLFNQTMLMLAPWVRDTKMRETFKEGRDEALTTLEFAKIDQEVSDTDNYMVYGVLS